MEVDGGSEPAGERRAGAADARGEDSPGDPPPCEGTMLEHPVFVHWCVDCGQEAPREVRQCPRCAGRVQRHQRVLELPDEDEGPLSLRSLKAALADVSASQDVGSSAVLLSQTGADPGVVASLPDFAEQLCSLGVPPAVQRALVGRGFKSLAQIASAYASAPSEEGALAAHLGLSPAAEVLLRRLWHVATEFRAQREDPKRPAAMASAGRRRTRQRSSGDAPRVRGLRRTLLCRDEPGELEKRLRRSPPSKRPMSAMSEVGGAAGPSSDEDDSSELSSRESCMHAIEDDKLDPRPEWREFV